jgi:stage V sporulation protein D (sporulation-specific penicillin-binding protein)
LQNSCNPAFIEWGFNIGKSKFIEYYEAFGYTDKCGTDMYAESNTIYFKTTGQQFEQTELATYSFGQTFRTTMVQQIRGVSAVANGGTLVTPHACMGICDSNGNILEKYEFESKLQVLSQNTSNTILSILEEGSTMGTTKNATVAGYSIAAKTGTSQKRDQSDENIYIGSCVAFAPAEKPEIAILIAIDEPKSVDSNGNLVFYGGVIAAPVVSKVLTEVLPYMEIPKSDENAPENVKIENYTGFSVLSAKERITAMGLKCKVIGSGDQVISQMPAAGEKVLSDGTVLIYTEEAETEYVVVPSFKGKRYDSVKKTLADKGLNLKYAGAYTGAGTPKAVSQSIPEGTKVKKGTVVEVEFFYDGIIG